MIGQSVDRFGCGGNVLAGRLVLTNNKVYFVLLARSLSLEPNVGIPRKMNIYSSHTKRIIGNKCVLSNLVENSL